jgi:hypothetical protein
MTQRYETGMRITFDRQSKTATVAFRGRLIRLSGQFADESAAISAGEDYCRSLGWIEKPAATAGRSLLRSRPLYF